MIVTNYISTTKEKLEFFSPKLLVQKRDRLNDRRDSQQISSLHHWRDGRWTPARTVQNHFMHLRCQNSLKAAKVVTLSKD